MSRVHVVNLSYVEVDPNATPMLQVDTRARFVLGADGRVRCFTRTENFRDDVLPELISGGLPDPATGRGVHFAEGRKYLDFLRQLIRGSALTTSDILELDEDEARAGFPFEYLET